MIDYLAKLKNKTKKKQTSIKNYTEISLFDKISNTFRMVRRNSTVFGKSPLRIHYDRSTKKSDKVNEKIIIYKWKFYNRKKEFSYKTYSGKYKKRVEGGCRDPVECF